MTTLTVFDVNTTSLLILILFVYPFNSVFKSRIRMFALGRKTAFTTGLQVFSALATRSDRGRVTKSLSPTWFFRCWRIFFLFQDSGRGIERSVEFNGIHCSIVVFFPMTLFRVLNAIQKDSLQFLHRSDISFRLFFNSPVDSKHFWLRGNCLQNTSKTPLAIKEFNRRNELNKPTGVA